MKNISKLKQEYERLHHEGNTSHSFKKGVTGYTLLIGVQWYTIGGDSWNISFNTRKFSTDNERGIYETLYLGYDELELKLAKQVWLTYMGEEMPYFKKHDGSDGQSVCRAEINEYPANLIHQLTKLSTEDNVLAFVKSKYKWWLLADCMDMFSFMDVTDNDPYPHQNDKFSNEEEISRMELFFETYEELESYCNMLCDKMNLKEIRNEKLSEILD